MDLSKSYDFFQPEKDDARIHIVGCGSVGSTLAENLARCGVTKMTLWDFDTVEAHNIVNQMFRQEDVGKPKVEALKDILMDINPEIKDNVELKPKGWEGKLMSGYIFLCVDNIELRRTIVEKHMDSPYVKAVFDFRTLLESAQHYAADWSDYKMKQDLLKSMQFSHEEAAEETPVSACGITLGVATTVRLICALGVNNYINFVKGNGIKKLIMIDGFHFMLDAF
ncbi:MAG: ThiF family adenylyltransferase [Eubacteriales bacterium]|nr:ThiF family adenylyltransferase [Eubacteriales bacterium]